MKNEPYASSQMGGEGSGIWEKSVFFPTTSKFCYHHEGTPKRQHFRQGPIQLLIIFVTILIDKFITKKVTIKTLNKGQESGQKWNSSVLHISQHT